MIIVDKYAIGKNIRTARIAKMMRQEELAEKTNLSPTYIGMIERGEKCPSLDSFIAIVNALEVSADVILCTELSTGYAVKNSILNEKLEKLTREDQDRIYDVIETLIRHAKKKLP